MKFSLRYKDFGGKPYEVNAEKQEVTVMAEMSIKEDSTVFNLKSPKIKEFLTRYGFYSKKKRSLQPRTIVGISHLAEGDIFDEETGYAIAKAKVEMSAFEYINAFNIACLMISCEELLGKDYDAANGVYMPSGYVENSDDIDESKHIDGDCERYAIALDLEQARYESYAEISLFDGIK